MLRALLPLLLLVSTLRGEPQKSPAQLDSTLRNLAPSLVESTIAIFLGGGSGSGVIVSPEGLVITAAHVTSKPNQQIKVLLSDGRELPATTLGVDHETDGALLQINAPGPFPYRPYLRTKAYQVGDWAIATGHPGGPVVGRPSPIRLGRILADGIGGGLTDPITTDATVISGDSGGPLFNLKGEVIGINSNIAMPWNSNRHVPMPAIIAKWDALIAGETIGQATGGAAPEYEELFDEPYRDLRQKFYQTLEDRIPHDPAATELHARPTLLGPHEMQRYLDQWDPDPEAPSTPFLGLKLDLGETSRVLVGDVIPNSPAENAGLQKGDLIQRIGDQEVSSPIAFALALKSIPPGKSLTLETTRGPLTLTPTETPARRHFPMPIAGIIPMMISSSAAKTPPSIRALDSEFLSSLTPLHDELRFSVLPIYQRDNLLTHATAVTNSQLITKASELAKKADLHLRFEGRELPFSILSTDDDRDLALISVKADGLRPIRLRALEPEVATLVLTPRKNSFFYGVITQPARSAPATGFELNIESNQASGYVGVTFSPDNLQPTIQSVDLGSPADSAGFLEGDLVTHFEGREMTSVEDLAQALKKFAPGQKVKFRITRGTDELTIPVILDARPPAPSDQPNQAALMRDQALSSLSARGGNLSKRRSNFPRVLYHDQLLPATHTGTPLLNVAGEVIGINISRSLRHRTLALPMSEIVSFFREQLAQDRRTD